MWLNPGAIDRRTVTSSNFSHSSVVTSNFQRDDLIKYRENSLNETCTIGGFATWNLDLNWWGVLTSSDTYSHIDSDTVHTTSYSTHNKSHDDANMQQQEEESYQCRNTTKNRRFEGLLWLVVKVCCGLLSSGLLSLLVVDVGACCRGCISLLSWLH